MAVLTYHILNGLRSRTDCQLDYHFHWSCLIIVASVLDCQSRGRGFKSLHARGEIWFEISAPSALSSQLRYILSTSSLYMYTDRSTGGGKMGRRRRELATGHPTSYAEAKKMGGRVTLILMAVSGLAIWGLFVFLFIVIDHQLMSCIVSYRI